MGPLADFFEMKFDEIPGSNALLVRLLQDHRTNHFIGVEPGGKVDYGMFSLKA